VLCFIDLRSKVRVVNWFREVLYMNSLEIKYSRKEGYLLFRT